MKRILFTLIFALCSLTASAQCAVHNEAIKPGEILKYDLKFNWKFIWINAGWAKMTVNETMYKGEKCLKADLLSYTNKRIDRFFKMRDTLTAVTSLGLVPYSFRKGAEEGKNYYVDNVHYEYLSDGRCIVSQDRSKNGSVPEKRKELVSECVFDMLSILLRARSFDASGYTVGQKIRFPMATGKKIEQQTLIYRGKKNYKAENEVTYRCLVFSLVEYNDKGKEKEIITFYVTDDKNHLPVRIDLFLNFGSAKAFLSEVKGNRHPLTSIVK